MKKRIWKNRIVASVMAGILFLSQHSISVFAAGVVGQIGKETGIVQEETEILDKSFVEKEGKVPTGSAIMLAASLESNGFSDVRMLSPVITANRSVNRHFFSDKRVFSYLMQDNDGYTRIEAYAEENIDNSFIHTLAEIRINPATKIIVEHYNNEFQLESQKYISIETLDDAHVGDGILRFGGFLEGEQNYYITYCQSNPKESDDVEVFRIVKYSKDWERLDSASVYGCNTKGSGKSAYSLRMCESNGILYIRTGHVMYQSSDGMTHQSNMTIQVKESDMSIMSIPTYFILFGYVSHSFDQYIAADGDYIITLDLGDGFPRAVRLGKYYVFLSDEKIDNGYHVTALNGDQYYYEEKEIDVLKIKGKSGNNYTGVTLGGLVCTDSSYLMVGSSVIQDENWNSYEAFNVFVGVTPKENFTEDATEIKWITNYKENGEISASAPKIVQIKNDRYLLIWEQMDGEGVNHWVNSTGKLSYVFIDGKGNLLSEIYEADGYLSDCQPICKNGTAVWYESSKEGLNFYTIDGENGTFHKQIVWGLDVVEADAENTSEGVKLTWDAVDGAEGYYVFKNVDEKEDIYSFYGKIAEVSANKTSYIDTKIETDHIYLYRIYAYGKGIQSPKPSTVRILAVIPTYTVTVNGGSGDGTYEAGEDVSIKADTPEIGKRFKEWEVTKGRVTFDKTSRMTTFIMPEEDVEIEAIFENSSGGGGTGHGSGGGGGSGNSTPIINTNRQGIQISSAGKRFLKEDGSAAKNEWVRSQNIWYYAGADGILKVGWLQLNGKWYYLKGDCAMAAGWQYINQKWYYLDEVNGNMIEGWKFIKGKWYYLNRESGDMATGWKFINNKWYYLNPDGSMAIGWNLINNKWYYLTAQGDCIINSITPDGYFVDENGVWVQ